MIIAKYRPSIMFGKCLRLDHLYDPSHDMHAKCGHYWWFWLPYYYNNGGSIRKGSACVEHSFKWLCFYMNVYLWRVKQ